MDISKFHCTHAYLGEMPNALAMEEVKNTIKSFFRTFTPKRVEWSFNQRSYLGEHNEIPVLLLDSPEGISSLHLLREKLPLNTQFKDWKPHVSTDLDNFSGVIDRYSLVSKNDDGSVVEEIIATLH